MVFTLMFLGAPLAAAEEPAPPAASAAPASTSDPGGNIAGNI